MRSGLGPGMSAAASEAGSATPCLLASLLDSRGGGQLLGH